MVMPKQKTIAHSAWPRAECLFSSSALPRAAATLGYAAAVHFHSRSIDTVAWRGWLARTACARFSSQTGFCRLRASVPFLCHEFGHMARAGLVGTARAAPVLCGRRALPCALVAFKNLSLLLAQV